MIERRGAARRPTFKFGSLKYDGLTKLGVVKNMSPAVAMVAVENSIGVPDEFTVDVEANLFTGLCRVAWKNAKQIGVRFVRAGQAENNRLSLRPAR